MSSTDGPTMPTTADLIQVAVGGDFACALRRDGTIACWGNNLHGEASPPTGAFW